MIAFRTQIKLKKTTEFIDIWKCFCGWTISSKRNRTTELVKFCSESSSKLITCDKTFSKTNYDEKLNSFSNEKINIFCIVFTQSYENGDIYKTSIVFNKNINYMSFEADAVNKKNGSIPPYSRPKFFQYIKPFIDANDIPDGYISSSALKKDVLAEIITGKKNLVFPVVYISTKSDGTCIYSDEELNELSKCLYCVAYVIKETDYETSLYLRNHTNEENAYNGAVGVYWQNKKWTYFNKPISKLSTTVTKTLSLTPLKKELTVENAAINILENTLTDAIHSLFKPENLQKFLDSFKNLKRQEKNKTENKQPSDISTDESNILCEDLKAKNEKLKTEIEKLNLELESVSREKDDYKELLAIQDEETKEKDALIQSLKSDNESLQNKCTSYEYNWKNNDSQKENAFSINTKCSEKELFPGEISSYLKGLLWQAFEKSNKTTKSIREKDVLSSLITENPDFNFEKSDTAKQYDQMKENIINNCHTSEYKKVHEGKHVVVNLYDDSRYQLTEPKTPGDERDGKNLYSEAEKHFLKPNIRK